jgi:hypothetical protein
MYDAHRQTATRGAKSTCPGCDGPVIAKCGKIIAPHWAHVAADCDRWSEPESAWHIGWKRWFEDNRDAKTEVIMGAHRADVVLPTGEVVELQTSYLSTDEIAERERHYGHMRWVYRCDWHDRIQFGNKGFWWKHGSKAMATSSKPIWWDMGNARWLVRLAVVDGGSRVVGSVSKVIYDGPIVASKAATEAAQRLSNQRKRAEAIARENARGFKCTHCGRPTVFRTDWYWQSWGHHCDACSLVYTLKAAS